ncbi:hypothetical protein F4820DRAFT_107046 [Hypoxylon rubiginosum]|uniref:Uncharacterized protein n=1 Tax=Hypoxylon rubiginosum TaxID=110542 RepID=A0ACB9YMT0_9PEZI|nr:hypothetical protein F4820DRAFT_107046 [Hypoxylon rubiginosum]
MASLGSLTTVFTPSGTGCQSTHIGIGGATWIQQGTVSDCFPSNFRPQNGYYYSPGICPQSMTYACRVGVGLGSSIITAATCCPSGFTCRVGIETGDPNACGSTMTSDSSYIVDVLTYSTGSPTKVGTTSAFYRAGNPVFAKGLVVWRAATDAEWPASATAFATLSTTSTPTSSPTLTGPITPAVTESVPAATSTGSLGNSTTSASITVQTASSTSSTEARIGLVVGISLGVLVFIGAVVAAYLFGKRKKHGLRDKPALSVGTSEERQDLTIPNYELEEQRRTVELSSRREPAELMGSDH